MYCGPMVKLRINNSDIEVIASKDIVCRYSSHSRAIFEGNFTEAQNQTASFEQIKGVVSQLSIKACLNGSITAR